MGVHQTKLRVGVLECGITMSDVSILTHVIGLVVMSLVMLFSYAALLEDGPLTAMTGFVFGFGFLLLIYGHHFDRFYIHFGDRIKFGGDAYDPQREAKIEIEENE